MEDHSIDETTETPSVVYATLVTLDGSQDGTEQHQLVTVPSDLNGQQIDLSAFANFAGQNGITVSDLQAAGLTGQTFQVFQAGDNHFTVVNPEDLNNVGETDSAITVQPLTIQEAEEEKEQAEETIKPPIPKGPYTCQLCSRIFPKWSQLQRHMKSHDDDLPFKCLQCEMGFNVQQNLILHESIHRLPSVCPECNKKFSRVASLKAHLLIHQRDESIICPECGDEFGVQSQLDRHMKEHKVEENGLFECHQCKQELPNMTSLKEHMKTHVGVRRNQNVPMKKLKSGRGRGKSKSYHPYKCPFCAKRFEKPSQLQRHLRVHTGERPYECNVCKKTFTQKGALQLHERTHAELRPYKCTHCPMKFSQKGNLRAHINRAHNNASNTFKCTECSCSFKRLGALNAHISRMHTTASDSLQASAAVLAGEGTSKNASQASIIDNVVQQILAEASLEKQGDVESRKRDLNKTVQEALAADSNVNTDILSQALSNSGLMPAGDEDTQLLKEKLVTAVTQAFASLETADETEHGTRVILSDSAEGLKKSLHTVRKVGGIRWHQCQYCTKEFKKPSDLVRHIRTHTHEKPYKCQQCYRSFTVRSTLTAHMRTHSGIKGFKCDICEKMFATHGSLNIHIRLHTGSKPFICNVCGKAFRTSGHLKNHETSHFKDSERPRRIAGPRLAKADTLPSLPDIELPEPIVITDSGLVQQPPRHSQAYQQLMGETAHDRPHKCTFCAMAFKKSSHLKQHIRSHTGEKPYQCVQCTRSFVSSGVLKAHMKTHTGAKNYKCLICDTTFTTNGSLKRHLSTHSEVRPYMCPYCQKTFKTSVNCKKHMKTHKHELAMALQSENMGDPVVTDLQALQNAAQSQSRVQGGEPTLITSVNPQTSDPLGVADSTLMTGVNQQYLTSGNDDLDESRTDTIIQDGQFSLNTQFISQNLGYNDRQILAQNFIGSNQQNLNQLNYNQPYTLDLGSLGSTNISNILQPRNSEVQVTQKDKSDQPAPIYTGDGGDGQVEGVQGQTTEGQTTHIINSESLVTDGTGVSGPQKITIIQQAGGAIIAEVTSTVPVVETHQPPTDPDEADTEHTEIVDDTAEDDQAMDDEPAEHLEEQAEEEDNQEPEEMEDSEEDEGMIKPKDPPQMGVGKRRYDCTKCDKTFPKLGLLKRHLQKHAAQKPFQCKKCKRACVSQVALQKHMKSHTTSKEYLCELCSSTYYSKASLNKHMMTHATFKAFKCQYCDNHFETSRLRSQHVEEAHQAPVTSAMTAVPPSQITSGGDGGIHVVKPARTRASRNSIVMVGSEFLSSLPSEDLTAPKPSTSVGHSRGVELDPQTVSERVLIEAAAERDRVSEVMDREKVNEKLAQMPKHPHQCKVCPRSFKKPSDLIRHFRIHTGEKPFTCDKCCKSFTVKSTLLSHLKTHKGHEKVYHCHLCNSPFATKGTLKVHMRLHTGAKPFKCNQCDATFRTSGHRKCHMLGHNKEANKQNRASRQTTRMTEQIQQGAQFINLDSLNAQQNTTSVLNMEPVIAIGDAQAAIPALDGIQLQLTNTITGQPGIQITGIDPAMLTQPLPLHIDNNLLAQLQQGGNLNITFNASGAMTGAQAVPISADQQFIQITTDNEMLQQATSQAGAVTVINTETTQDENQLSHVQMGDISTSVTGHVTAEGNSVTASGLLTSEAQDAGEVLSSMPHMAVIDTSQPGTSMALDDAGEVHIQTGSVVHSQQPGEMPTEPMIEISVSERRGRSSNTAVIVEEDEEESDDDLTDINNLPDSALVCHICNKITKDENQLAEHLVAHDDNFALARIKKINKCQVCKKQFDKPSQLERHIRIHTGEKPFLCALCNKGFNQKNTLQVHMAKHTGLRPYACPLCSVRFTQKGNMKTHIRRAHPEFECVPTDGVPMDHTDLAQELQEELQPSVSGVVQQDNPLSADDGLETGDDHSYLLYNIRDQI